MKYMYGYCREYFDTRHIVIAVNPNKIEMYESLLFFERLQAEVVDNYDFANGAPAVGAALDLLHAPSLFRHVYARRRERKNLYRYFVETRLPNIQLPNRRFFTTNDPVMTPAMLDYFFNQRTQVFAGLSDRQRLLLQSIYDHPDYTAILPQPSAQATAVQSLRRHQRYSIRCPARLQVGEGAARRSWPMQVIELSLHGFLAEVGEALPEGSQGRVEVELGQHELAVVEATALRRQDADGQSYYAFHLPEPDEPWRRCVAALEAGHTHADLQPLTPAKLAGGGH